jgi:Ca2+/Na+ antiporter
MKNRIFVYSLFKMCFAMLIMLINLLSILEGNENWVIYLSFALWTVLFFKFNNDLNKTLKP